MHNLERFLLKQEKDYQTALNEIKSGFKKTHWIWYIFPQLDGLVYAPSENTKNYSLKNKAEAIAYYNHPILQSRLLEITQELLAHKNKNIQQIMGEVDSVKLRSCMTLFDYISGNEISVFREILDQYFSGEVDQKTIEILSRDNKTP
jgi:uncharacterized protein (DUF1810 family)